jgi:hypothetical protein
MMSLFFYRPVRGSGFGNSQIPADFSRQKFVNFGMSGHGGAKISRRVSPPRMVAPFPDEYAALPGQVPDEFPPFHTRIEASS